MNETKWTPGPWVQDNPNYTLVAELVNGVYEYIADCGTSLIDRPQEECEANARLISAAPELYEALEKFRLRADAIVAAQGGDIILRVPTTVIATAAAALARARGES